MDSTSASSEAIRLVGLLVAALAVELFVLSPVMFWLLATSVQWPLVLQLLVIAIPRFLAMAILVSIIGRFRRQWPIAVFTVAYVGMLLVRFDRTEAFVDWGDTIGAARAILPYLGGLLGAVLGLWLARSAVVSNSTTLRA